MALDSGLWTDNANKIAGCTWPTLWPWKVEKSEEIYLYTDSEDSDTIYVSIIKWKESKLNVAKYPVYYFKANLLSNMECRVTSLGVFLL